MSNLLRVVAWLFFLGVSQVWAADPFEESLQRLRQIEGTDLPAVAAPAWRIVSAAEPARLPQVLAAIDSSQSLAANWLRSAADAIAERAVAESQPLPTDELEAFVTRTQHDPRARRQAFELLRQVAPEKAAELIPGMLQDPSVELRRDSVALRMRQAEQHLSSNQQQAAIEAYRQALDGARDEDQVKEIAKALRDMEQEIDLPRHFGFIQQWHLIAPFANTERSGLDTVYPPETQIDLAAQYPGKDGLVKWQSFIGQDDFGMIDLNKPFGSQKEVVGYAWTEFHSDTEREVELRLGCKNAWKLWVNGELLFSRNEYHRGMKIDQYRLPVKMNAGANQILVKLCQNEQTESWTTEWQFQLRVCDATGTAILSSETKHTN